jgi:hypothetical protein
VLELGTLERWRWRCASSNLGFLPRSLPRSTSTTSIIASSTSCFRSLLLHPRLHHEGVEAASPAAPATSPALLVSPHLLCSLSIRRHCSARFVVIFPYFFISLFLSYSIRLGDERSLIGSLHLRRLHCDDFGFWSF